MFNSDDDVSVTERKTFSILLYDKIENFVGPFVEFVIEYKMGIEFDRLV